MKALTSNRGFVRQVEPAAVSGRLGRPPGQRGSAPWLNRRPKHRRRWAKKVITDLEADFDNVYGGYWNMLLKEARPEVAAQVGKDEFLKKITL